MKKGVMVSVYCLTYNQEQYIRDTLEGFINQKTKFDYEVFVHDDASTDSTREIIREYAEKFPELIYPIFQSTNQYSKGENIISKYIFPLMTGKYIAACEGDDYWCDENKLQKQVEFLESNNEYSACAHNTLVLDFYHNKERNLNCHQKEYDVKIETVLKDGGIDFHTSSLMYRRQYGEVMYSEVCPEFFRKAKRVADYPKAIFLALNGKIRFFPEIMSVYRLGTEGSWTKSVENREMLLEVQKSLIDMLKSVDEYTKYSYHLIIQSIIEKRILLILDKAIDIEVLKSIEIRTIIRKQTIKNRIKIYIKLFWLNKIRMKKR